VKQQERIRKTAVFGASLGRTYPTGQAAFVGIDTSKDGVIDAAELATAAGQFQYSGQSADLFQDLDVTRDGQITLSELSKFEKDYMPQVGGVAGAVAAASAVSWRPGYKGQFDDKREMPNTAAHRRRTIGGLSAATTHVGIGPDSQVLWMRLGRTTSLCPVAWVGEYNELGDGLCRTMEAHTPVSVDILNTPEGTCQGKCDTSVACYGFSWSRDGGGTCRLWKESGLRGGGHNWGGCKCKVKAFDIVQEPVVSSGEYVRMGSGKCLAGAGRDYPESVFHQNVDENFCKSRCTQSPECFGYTWSAQLKHCYLWKLTDLRAPPDGTMGTAGEACMLKMNKISQTTGQQSNNPPNAAALLGAYDLGDRNIHAMKFSLGRSTSSVAVTWTGKWKTQAPAEGRCMTSTASQPASRIHRHDDEMSCRKACGDDFSCYGYSWASTGECMTWMQPDLWGGGPKTGGFGCITKQFGVLTTPVASTGQFTMAGPGMCKTGWDTNPASTYLGKVKRAACRGACEDDSTCTGFSWQPSGECAIHYEAGLRSSRSTYSGNIACYVKDYKQAIGAETGGNYARAVGPPPQGQGLYSGQQQNQYGSGNNYGGAAVGAAAGMAAGGVNAGYSSGNNGYGNNNNQQRPQPSYQENTQSLQTKPDSNNADNGYNNQQVQQGGGHSNMAVLGSTLAGAMMSHNMFGQGGNNNNQQNNNGNYNNGYGNFNNNGNQNNQGNSNEGFARPPPPLYKFDTPNNPGSATCYTDKPGRSFPLPAGASLEDLASPSLWPSGHQPQTTECWDKEANDGLASCWYTKVLYSTEEGWPGKCQGLMVVDTGDISCQESCVRDTKCPVWRTHWEAGGKLVCMQGRGRDCAGMRSGRNDRNVDSSARIQHGAVRVLKDLMGMQIKNLRQDFDAGYYSRRSDAVLACKNMCYSTFDCTYWTYSTTDGCYVEDPPIHIVRYPLTQDDVTHNVRDVIAGEYILHRCPENDGEVTSADEGAQFTMLPWEWNWFAFHWPWDEGGWSIWAWLLFGVLACCLCGCGLMCCGAFGVCRLIRNRAKHGSSKTGASDANEDDSSSSSDSETERKGRHTGTGGSQKQALLTT